MAIFNEILSGRFNRSLQKIFAIKGSPPVRQLGGEITPTHSIFSGVENRFPESWQRFGFLLNAPAGGAGILAACKLRNPPGSNVVCVIESFIMSFASLNIVGAVIDLGASLTDYATVLAPPRTALDNRQVLNGQPVSVAILSVTAGLTAQQVPPTIAVIPISTIGGSSPVWQQIQHVDQELTVLPGDAIQARDSTSGNSTLSLSVTWRERVLEDSERI